MQFVYFASDFWACCTKMRLLLGIPAIRPSLLSVFGRACTVYAFEATKKMRERVKSALCAYLAHRVVGGEKQIFCIFQAQIGYILRQRH